MVERVQGPAVSISEWFFEPSSKVIANALSAGFRRITRHALLDAGEIGFTIGGDVHDDYPTAGQP